MANSPYDSTHLARFYDSYGELEWHRLERSASHRVNLHVHLEILNRYMTTGSEVLEIGPGPGRFTIPMARLGAMLTLGDISKTQLDLNAQRLSHEGLESSIRARHHLDVIDLSIFPDNSFDVATAYGGPISYIFDKGRQAIEELLRVTKPGGYVLFSVMSKWGSTRLLLPAIVSLLDHYDMETLASILRSGDVHEQIKAQHRFHMYSSQELRELIASIDCELIEMRASGFLSVQNDLDLDGRWEDESFWQTFLEWEVEASQQPGALDASTHIITVLRKR